jgi:hypothetical protein
MGSIDGEAVLRLDSEEPKIGVLNLPSAECSADEARRTLLLSTFLQSLIN